MEELINVGADGAGAAPNLIDPKNYVSSKKVRDRVRSEILSKLDPIRAQREELNERWDRLHKVYIGKHTVKLYEGQSDMFIPMCRKVVEVFISNLMTQTFPSDPLFFLGSGNFQVEQDIALKMVIKSLIENDIEQAKVQSRLPLFLQRGLILGPSFLKVQWKTKTSRQIRRTRLDPEVGAPTLDFSFEPQAVRTYEGPTFDVVDANRIYIHPITAPSISEARMVFEDIDVDASHLRAMQKAGRYANVNKVISEGPKTKSNVPDTHRDEALTSYGYTTQDPVLEDRYRITEIWALFDLYGDGEAIPTKIVVSGDHILEIRQNPFHHQEFPYLMWRVTEMVDNVYGQGVLENLEYMQHAFNAVFNQGIDNATWQMNPMMIVNKAQLAMRPGDIAVAPRSMVWTYSDSPNSIRFERPPETYNIAFNVAQLLAGMIQDMAGTPPIAQGKIAERTQTATEADILARGAGASQNMMAQKLESEVLSPMLRMFWQLEQQYRMDATWVKITGAPPVRLDPADIVGDYSFTWHVASGAVQRMAVQQAGGGLTAAPAGQPVADQSAGIAPNQGFTPGG